jgi:uncharacterized membrane protein YcaP (DUF421 family)
MPAVLRAAAIYLFLMLVFRIAGRRTLHQITPFDVVLLLIISESIQQGMIGQDNSVINAVLLVLTLVGIDVLLSVQTSRYPRNARLTSGEPILIVANGMWFPSRMKRLRVTREDVLAAARELHGLARADQILFAVVESSGQITIVPRTERP